MADKLTFKNIERTENLQRYLDDIRKYDVLTPEQEYEYIVKAKAGDKNAIDMLVNCNQRYIYSLCKKYSTAYNVLDLVSEANDGFIEGILKFDETRGFKLTTYAQHYATQRIKAYLINENLTVKKSNYNKTYSRVNKIKNKFFVENGRMPQIEEIQEILKNEYGVEIKELCDLIDVNINSINQSMDDGESFYEETPEFNSATSSINLFELESDREYQKALVTAMLSTISERERTIVKKVFGIDCDAQEMDAIAKEMGMSKERIRQIRISACEKMKEMFTPYKKRVI